MTFDLEVHPRIAFRWNPLKVVVVQIRFPALYGLVEPASLAVLQAALGRRYPIAMPRAQQVTLSIAPNGEADSRVEAGPVRFASDDNRWVVSVATDSISLETTSYDSWTGFRTRFSELMAALPDALQPVRSTRIGMRYVDQLQAADAAEPADWRRYIAPSLLGADDSLIFDNRLVQGLQQLSFRLQDDAVNVRHGYVRNEPGSSHPSTYVIDADLFTEVEQPFDPASILDRLDGYHVWAWNLFRRSITDAAVDLLMARSP